MYLCKHTTSSLRILIVDDEMDIANSLKRFVIKSGFDAISFTDRAVALAHFTLLHNRYSVIITDLRMPGMSGLEFTNEIRKINFSVRVFLIKCF